MAHTTKYGNTYTDEEWRAKMRYFELERASNKKMSTEIDALDLRLEKALAHYGVQSIEVVKRIVIDMAVQDFIDAGRITEKFAPILLRAQDWYYDELGKIVDTHADRMRKAEVECAGIAGVD